MPLTPNIKLLELWLSPLQVLTMRLLPRMRSA
jgi:hypothetical protein